MPLYEYKCVNCGKVFDKFYVSYKERKDELKCPNCNRPAKYNVSNTSFVLKGGGWESDGYSKNN